nr:ABC transporter permease subunit [Saccharomonospora saliphila]
MGRLLASELRLVFSRPRTLVVLGLLGLIPVIVGVALTLVDSPGPPGGGGDGDGGGIMFSAGANALVLPVGALMMALNLLLPLAAAMAGADAVAGEQTNGSLRGWLLAPVSRGRLLLVKAFGVAVLALTAAAVMAVSGMLTGLAINGAGSLFTLSGTTLSLGEAGLRVLLAIGWVAVQLWAVGAVALAISTTTEHPMLVMASVLGGVVVFNVLGLLEALSWLHPVLLTTSFDAIVDLLRDPMPLDGLGEGLARAACYVVIALSLASARLLTRDG